MTAVGDLLGPSLNGLERLLQIPTGGTSRSDRWQTTNWSRKSLLMVGRNPAMATTTWDVFKNPVNGCKWLDFNYQPQLVNAGFQPSTVRCPAGSDRNESVSLVFVTNLRDLPYGDPNTEPENGNRTFAFRRWFYNSWSSSGKVIGSLGFGENIVHLLPSY